MEFFLKICRKKFLRFLKAILDFDLILEFFVDAVELSLIFLGVYSKCSKFQKIQGKDDFLENKLGAVGNFGGKEFKYF